MKSFIILCVLAMTVCIMPQAHSQAPSGMDELTATVSTDADEIRAEGEKLGIPSSQLERYVVDMRSINKQYQSGALTKTEYIAFKRQVIERLK